MLEKWIANQNIAIEKRKAGNGKSIAPICKLMDQIQRPNRRALAMIVIDMFKFDVTKLLQTCVLSSSITPTGVGPSGKQLGSA